MKRSYAQKNAAQRLNLVMEEANFVMASFKDITDYLQRKGFLAP